MQTAAARFLRYLSVERNAAPLTIKSYREDLAALVDYLTQAYGRAPGPAEITPLDLRGYVAAMHDAGYAKTSVARRTASLRTFFKYCLRENLCQSNPAKPLRTPRKDRKLPHFLSTSEIGRLLDAPPAARAMGLRDRAILETMYSAGLRVSELVGINDGDLDLAEALVRIRGKGRRERLAPLGSFAVQALRRWLAKRELSPKERPGALAPVFTNKFGRRLTTRSVARMLEKYLKLTGLDLRTTPHPSINRRVISHLCQAVLPHWAPGRGRKSRLPRRPRKPGAGLPIGGITVRAGRHSRSPS